MVVPFMIGMYFCPESPRWLFAKGRFKKYKICLLKNLQTCFEGRDQEGKAALEWLRGKDAVDAIHAETKAIKREQIKKAESKVSGKIFLC